MRSEVAKSRAIPGVGDALRAQGSTPESNTQWYHNSVQRKAQAKLAAARTPRRPVAKALGGSTPAIARRVASLGSGVRPPTAPMPAKQGAAAGSKSLRPLNQQGLRQPTMGQSQGAKRQSFPRL